MSTLLSLRAEFNGLLAQLRQLQVETSLRAWLAAQEDVDDAYAARLAARLSSDLSAPPSELLGLLYEVIPASDSTKPTDYAVLALVFALMLWDQTLSLEHNPNQDDVVGYVGAFVSAILRAPDNQGMLCCRAATLLATVAAVRDTFRQPREDVVYFQIGVAALCVDLTLRYSRIDRSLADARHFRVPPGTRLPLVEMLNHTCFDSSAQWRDVAGRLALMQDSVSNAVGKMSESLIR